MALGDEFKDVRPGDNLTIPAHTWNALMHELRRARAQLESAGSPGGDPVRCDILIKHQNVNATNAVDAYSVYCMSALLPTFAASNNLAGFKSRPAVVSTAQDAKRGKFAITQEAIPYLKTGRATVSGVSICKIDRKDPTHDYADNDMQFTVAGGSNSNNFTTDRLITCADGSAKILFSESSSLGTQWAIVQLGLKTLNPLCTAAATWGTNNTNTLKVNNDVWGYTTSGTMNVSLTLPPGYTGAIPPPIDLTAMTPTRLPYAPLGLPRITQGTNNIDGFLTSYPIDGGPCFFVNLIGSGSQPNIKYQMTSYATSLNLGGSNTVALAKTRSTGGTNAATSATYGIAFCSGGSYVLGVAFEV